MEAERSPIASTTNDRWSKVVVPIVAGIGNALMAEPMVRALKHQRPDSRIVVAARTDAMAEVFRRSPGADEVWVSGSGPLAMWRASLLVRRLRTDAYLIPFPSNRWQYALLALASGAQRRVLHRYPTVRALGWIRADREPAVRGIHDVQQNLNLLRRLGLEPGPVEPPDFPVRDADRAAADRMLEAIGWPDSTQPVAVHAGSGQTPIGRAKRWPAGNYGQLIHRLGRMLGERLLVLEGPDEPGVSDQIVAGSGGDGPRVLRLRGGLGDAAAVLERAELYVGTDSGLAHLAAAVRTPAVTLFAPGDPDRVCPFGNRHLVVQPQGKTCTPCLRYPWESTRPKIACRAPMCIDSITVDSVLAAVTRALGR